ncbi:TIGR03087 family PEP-CTERM/XrtA system glycosyltransferase [Geoalkalibacter halelectricus]|uniref:TIGR03087 family PEP-CTERM/XrtA system glycosyltransferase n=1 Tax=Geoalkalibacter halelectricus TaxID=2847045 RepID=UPI003D204ADA
MKILYICHRIPYPPNKGDKIRSFNEVKYLAKDHDLFLAFLVDDPADTQHVDALREYCVDLAFAQIDPRAQKVKAASQAVTGKALSVPYFYSPKLQQEIDAWASTQDFDAVVCFSGPMAEYVYRSSLWKKADRPRLIMDFCDVDSDKWGQYAQDAKFPMNLVYSLEQKRLLAYEAQVNRDFDHSVFVTDNEAQLFNNQVPDARNLTTVGNGVDFEFFNPGFRRGEACLAQDDESDHVDQGTARRAPTNLVFTGAMDYHANVDAVVWFCSDILPRITQAGIDAHFYIVGGRPAPAVQALAQNPRVTVTGFVEDIRPWYAKADLCVIPLRLARGVQNKVLEAMAMERPVVTTSKAAQGVGAKDLEHLWVADSAESIAATVIDLCRNPDTQRELGQAGRKFVVENFDWRRNMEKLEKLLS